MRSQLVGVFLLFAVVMVAACDGVATEPDSPSPVIKVEKTSYSVDYGEITLLIPYSVENSRGGKVSVESSQSWLNVISVEGNAIKIAISENNTGGERKANLTLQYTGASLVIVFITQEWAAPSIKLEPSSIEFDYTGGSGFFSYEIENLRHGLSLAIDCKDNWITDIRQDGLKVFFIVAENNSGASRSGKISLKYGGAVNDFVITQKWGVSSIIIEPSSVELDYSGGASSFGYVIENPRQSISLTIGCEDEWITNIKHDGSRVSFLVTENNSGKTRTGKITLKYGSDAKVFVVTQKWAAASIILNSSEFEFDYSGGEGSFSYKIENPRQGQTLTVECGDDWITSIRQNGSNVSFRVEENNSKKERFGSITLIYGVNTYKNITIKQTYAAPRIDVSHDSQWAEYTGGSYSAIVEIVNPRQSGSVKVSKAQCVYLLEGRVYYYNCSWISNVRLDGKVLSYYVEAHSSARTRGSGLEGPYIEIDYTYGSNNEYTVKDHYYIYQKGAPVTDLTLNKNALMLYSGNSEKLIATVKPSDAELIWTTKNESVATVDSTGNITAVGSGTTVITVESKDGLKSISCEVIVKSFDGGNEGIGEEIWK